MGARKMVETGSGRKKASGVGLGGIFNRKNSTEKFKVVLGNPRLLP